MIGEIIPFILAIITLIIAMIIRYRRYKEIIKHYNKLKKVKKKPVKLSKKTKEFFKYFYLAGIFLAIIFAYISYTRGYHYLLVLVYGIVGFFSTYIIVAILGIIFLIFASILSLFNNYELRGSNLIIKRLFKNEEIYINELYAIFYFNNYYYFCKTNEEFEQMKECLADKGEPPSVSVVEKKRVDIEKLLSKRTKNEDKEFTYWK